MHTASYRFQRARLSAQALQTPLRSNSRTHSHYTVQILILAAMFNE